MLVFDWDVFVIFISEFCFEVENGGGFGYCDGMVVIGWGFDFEGDGGVIVSCFCFFWYGEEWVMLRLWGDDWIEVDFGRSECG